MSFSPFVVGCMLKKSLQMRGITDTQDPSWLRPCAHPVSAYRPISGYDIMRDHNFTGADYQWRLQSTSLQMKWVSTVYKHLSYKVTKSNLMSICSLNVLTSWSRSLFISSGFLSFSCPFAAKTKQESDLIWIVFKIALHRKGLKFSQFYAHKSTHREDIM